MIFGSFTDVRMTHFALVFKSRMFFRIEEEEFVWIFFEFQNLIQIFSEFQNSKLKNFTFEFQKISNLFWIWKIEFQFFLKGGEAANHWREAPRRRSCISQRRRRWREAPQGRTALPAKPPIQAPKALARSAERQRIRRRSRRVDAEPGTGSLIINLSWSLILGLRYCWFPKFD